MFVQIEGEYKIGSKKLGPITLYKGSSGLIHVGRDIPTGATSETDIAIGPMTFVVAVGLVAANAFGAALAIRVPFVGTRKLLSATTKMDGTKPFNLEIDRANYVRGTFRVLDAAPLPAA